MNKNVYLKFSTLILVLFLFSACNSSQDFITVKYREKNPINISSFEYYFPNDTVVKKIWYDENQEYMIIRLKSTNYHYCRLSRKIINECEEDDFSYNFYTVNIRKGFDCRKGGVGIY